MWVLSRKPLFIQPQINISTVSQRHLRGLSIYSCDSPSKASNYLVPSIKTDDSLLFPKRAMILHRINGYLVLILLIPSTVAGAVVARRAWVRLTQRRTLKTRLMAALFWCRFGGELNVQSGFYTVTLLIILCASFGITNVKHTRKHRKWMLREYVFLEIVGAY